VSFEELRAPELVEKQEERGEATVMSNINYEILIDWSLFQGCGGRQVETTPSGSTNQH
jgi:hypothetical protein